MQWEFARQWDALREYAHGRGIRIIGDIPIYVAMDSPARLCVISLQDYMGLDNSCRMNRPSSVGENWLWRVREESLSDALRQEIADVTRRYGRASDCQ